MDICEKIKQNLDLQSDIITDRPTHKHIPKKKMNVPCTWVFDGGATASAEWLNLALATPRCLRGGGSVIQQQNDDGTG